MGGTGKHPSGTIMSSNDLASHQTHKNEQFNELLEPPPMSIRVNVQLKGE